MRINVRRRDKSWCYDFVAPGHPRQRRAGFNTKAAARAAGEVQYCALLNRVPKATLAELYAAYLDASQLAVRTTDALTLCWRHIDPELGHFYVTEVNTAPQG